MRIHSAGPPTRGERQQGAGSSDGVVAAHIARSEVGQLLDDAVVLVVEHHRLLAGEDEEVTGRQEVHVGVEVERDVVLVVQQRKVIVTCTTKRRHVNSMSNRNNR